MLAEFWRENRMRNRLITLIVCLLAVSAVSQTKSAKKMMAPGAPDRALMEKIWAGWSTLNTDNVAGFYAKGPHTFYDIAPLKYASWNEYADGVKKELGDYKTAACTVNDDSQIHPAGDVVWGSATVKCDMTRSSGKRELSQFRWTVIWQKEGGQWLIVHEHVSSPID
jgi:ketosteroid isomerase-like protein